MDLRREDVENQMHKDRINEIEVNTSDGKTWICKYQETSRKKVDYAVLKDLVSDTDYDLIVSETQSESLVIREKKSKTPKKTERGAPKPIQQNTSGAPPAPKGTVSTGGNIPLV